MNGNSFFIHINKLPGTHYVCMHVFCTAKYYPFYISNIVSVFILSVLFIRVYCNEFCRSIWSMGNYRSLGGSKNYKEY